MKLEFHWNFISISFQFHFNLNFNFKTMEEYLKDALNRGSFPNLLLIGKYGKVQGFINNMELKTYNTLELTTSDRDHYELIHQIKQFSEQKSLLLSIKIVLLEISSSISELFINFLEDKLFQESVKFVFIASSEDNVPQNILCRSVKVYVKSIDDNKEGIDSLLDTDINEKDLCRKILDF